MWSRVRTVSGAAFLACGLLSAAAHAQQFTREEMNVMNHIAQALVIGDECPDLEANDSMLALAAVANEIDLEVPAVRRVILDKYAEHLASIRAIGVGMACRIGYELYGPDGSNVANLVRRR